MKIVVKDHDSNGQMFTAGEVHISKPENVYLVIQGKSYDLGWLLGQAEEYDAEVQRGEAEALSLEF